MPWDVSTGQGCIQQGTVCSPAGIQANPRSSFLSRWPQGPGADGADGAEDPSGRGRRRRSPLPRILLLLPIPTRLLSAFQAAPAPRDGSERSPDGIFTSELSSRIFQAGFVLHVEPGGDLPGSPSLSTAPAQQIKHPNLYKMDFFLGSSWALEHEFCLSLVSRFSRLFIRRSLRIHWILPLQGQESSPALKVTSREPRVPPSAQLEPRRAQ